MQKRTNEVTMQGKPITLLGPRLKAGDKAPDFTVVTNDLAPLKLSDFAGKVVIINAVPSIDTGVCDAQVRKFNQLAAILGNTVILSISVDLPFALSRYCAAEGINAVKTTSDYQHLDFGLKYGFVIEELRLLSRGIVVIDTQNVIQYIEYVKEVSDHPNYDAALEAAQKLLK